jgi:RNA polymerase sigma-70 factor (ECF subfamily)
MTLDNDHRLLKRIADSDMQALEEIYQRYYAYVYRYAFMVTNQPETSEDIAQTVFLKITKCAHQYRVPISVKAWIITITRSICLNVIKHNSYSVNMDIDELINIPSDQNDFDGLEFLSVIDGLSPTMREIIVLHLVYRFKHYEIARMLSKSPSAVRQQYKRAMDMLRKTIPPDYGSAFLNNCE